MFSKSFSDRVTVKLKVARYSFLKIENSQFRSVFLENYLLSEKQNVSH
jgi:hypothetical protein